MFRFTIRDLLWLMVVVGLAVGWIVDRRIVAVRNWEKMNRRDTALFEISAELDPWVNAEDAVKRIGYLRPVLKLEGQVEEVGRY